MPKQDKVKTQDIVILYTVQHLTTEEIGQIFKMTRQSICKRLKQAGISSHQGEWVTMPCDFCGSPINIRRCKWRKSNKHYCNNECYYASLENPACKNNDRPNLSVYATHSDHIKATHHNNPNVKPIWDGANI